VVAREPANRPAMPGYSVLLAGPLLLGYAPPDDPAATLRSPDPKEIQLPGKTGDAATGKYKIGDIVLAPINDLHDIPATPHDPCPRQILFRHA
jgi:hypothetical protein